MWNWSYLGNRSSKNLSNRMGWYVVAVTLEEFPFVKQNIHGEEDVLFVHPSSAISYDPIRIKGVMHHNQNDWFISCKYIKNIWRLIKKIKLNTWIFAVIFSVQLFIFNIFSFWSIFNDLLWTLLKPSLMSVSTREATGQKSNT